MVSTSPKTRRNRSLITGRHTVGGAPPPEAISAHTQDDLEEWFLLGLTCALVVRKRRGLSRQIWRAYQDRSINTLVSHPQRTASSRLKVYTNIKLQDTTPKLKMTSIYMKEATTPSQQKLSEKPRLFKTSIATWKPSNPRRIFSGTLDSLTPLNLKVFQQGFDKIPSATSTIQPSTSANEDDPHLQQNKVYGATQSIIGELKEQPLKPNSNLVSTPL
jgi:hypothetical protein